MEKVIKAIVLTNNQILISQIDEVGADIGQPDCKLTNPYMLKDDGTNGTMVAQCLSSRHFYDQF